MPTIPVKRGGKLARMLPGPFALAGRSDEIAVAAACIVLLLLVFAGDLLTPVQVALTALGLIPLLAAAWLLSDRLALAVAVVALGQLVLTAALGAVSVPTAVSEATAYVVLGLVIRLYAGSLAELLSRQAPVRRTDVTSRTGVETLTKREREVATLAAQGYTAREIGAQLHIGERTVETHVANVCSKLGLKAKVELVRSASRLGL
ncbi:MAG TPA: helix-turn-helix transcriptional regulator [Candidatus Dormibacteraeota bacterium]|nr:helix-turn-helix transcriptional regulator [Candidatus Dormibacteraeota bacterium]